MRAEISVRHIEQIEDAIRRTRRSTLRRIVSALVEVKPELGDPAELLERLVVLAGPGLAPESEYRERVERRRKRRWAKVRNRRRSVELAKLRARVLAEFEESRA